MVIRKAQKSDIPSILEIVNEQIATATSNYNYEPQTLEEQTNWYNDRLANNYPIYVSDENGHITGFGTYGRFREKEGYKHTVEHTVYIHKSHRGKGIGKSLMETLITTAKEEKYHVMIGGIDAENKKSIEFHKRLGFEEVAHFKQVGRKFDRWLDLVFMQLVLE